MSDQECIWCCNHSSLSSRTCSDGKLFLLHFSPVQTFSVTTWAFCSTLWNKIFKKSWHSEKFCRRSCKEYQSGKVVVLIFINQTLAISFVIWMVRWEGILLNFSWVFVFACNCFLVHKLLCWKVKFKLLQGSRSFNGSNLKGNQNSHCLLERWDNVLSCPCSDALSRVCLLATEL